MTIYAHVVDGTVVATGPLPDVWRWPDGTTTSGFPSLDPADHLAAGWLPLVDERPTPGPGQVRGADRFSVDGNEVTVTCDLVAAPPPTVQQLIAHMDPERLVRAIGMAGALTDPDTAAAFAVAVAAIAPSSTSKPALQIIDQAVTAAQLEP